MTKMRYDEAVSLQHAVQDAATALLRRYVGSSISLDRETDDWVVNLRINAALVPGEAQALADLGDRHGIRIAWIDRMEPARLAV